MKYSVYNSYKRTAISGKQAVYPAPEIENKMMNLPSGGIKLYYTLVKLLFPEGWRLSMAYQIITNVLHPSDIHEIDIQKTRTMQRHLLTQWSKDENPATKLKKLSLPTLILTGNADIIIPSINSDILSRTIPQSKLVEWSDGGHGMIYQYPNQIGQAINLFIAGTS